MAWQGLVAAGIVLALVRFGRCWPASLREGLLGVALVKFLLPPLAMPVGLFPWLSRLAASAPPRAGVVTSMTPAGNEATWWLAVYLCGVSIVLAATVRSLLRVRTLRRGAHPASDAVAARAAEMARRIGLRRAPEILMSSDTVAPVAIGVWRPAVVLPAAIEQSMSAEEIDAVLAHELGHHARGHLAWAWVRAVACTAWWWHPAVWVLAREQRRVNEETCDDLVVRSGILPGDRYCDVLVRAAGVSRSLLLSAPFADRLHPLGHRIRRLLNGEGPRAGSPAATRTVIVTAALLILPGLPVERSSDVPARTSPEAVRVAELPQSVQPAPSAPARSGAPRFSRPASATPATPRRLAPAPNPIDTVVDSVMAVADQAIDGIVAQADIGERFDPPTSPAPQPAPAAAAPPRPNDLDGADAREARARIAAKYEQQVYAQLREAGAPADVAHRVSRSVSNSITGENRKFWREAGRALGRLLR